MRPRTVAQLAAQVGGSVAMPLPAGSRGASRPPAVAGSTGPASMVQGVAIDSRRTTTGDLLMALRGEHADGHDFVGDAFAAGAVAAMVADDRSVGGKGPMVRGADTGRGLLDLAAVERTALDAVVVGITGSTGKTCTKDFIAGVLGTELRAVRSPASFNNEIGLPMTVLAAPPDTQALVLEMGARGTGQIRLLCEVSRPAIGVVTNVGVAHMELFGSASAIAEAKAELPESLPVEGWAVLNADDRVVRGYAGRTAAAAEREGMEPERIVRCADIMEAVAAVRAVARPGDLVLIKASRVAGLERVARALGGERAALVPGGGRAA